MARIQPAFRILAAGVLLLAAAGCRPRDPRELLISGRIEVDDSQIGSKIGGRVEKVNVEEGEIVKAGTVLVQLDQKELLAMLEQTSATAAQAQAQLDLLLAGTRKEDIEQAEALVAARQADLEMRRKGFRTQEVGQAQAQLDAARTALELARKDYERAQELMKEDVIGRQELDRRKTDYDNAQAQLKVAQQRANMYESGSRPEEIKGAEAALAQAQADLARLKNGPRPEEIAAQRAAVGAARANIDRILSQLDETRIVAPLEALVETLELHPGDMIRAGEPVATLNLLTRPWVRCYVPEDRLGWVRPGQVVSISVDSYPTKRFKGIVRRVNTEAEFTPRNVQTTEKRSEQVFQMKVDAVEDTRLLRAGMYADVHIPAPEMKAPEATPETVAPEVAHEAARR